MALILGWMFVGTSALAGVLTLLHLYETDRIEQDRLNCDIQTKAMWRERIWNPDNEH